MEKQNKMLIMGIIAAIVGVVLFITNFLIPQSMSVLEFDPVSSAIKPIIDIVSPIGLVLAVIGIVLIIVGLFKRTS